MARKKNRFDGEGTEVMVDPNQGSAKELPATTEAPFDLLLGSASADDSPSLEPAIPPPTPAPVPDPVPVAIPAPDLENRLYRLEEMLARLEKMQTSEPKVAAAIQTNPTPAHAPTPSSATIPSALGAAALVEAGRTLLPVMRAATADRPQLRGFLDIARDWFTELQAMFYMYVDPRYRMSWAGRIISPTLVLLFLTTYWWFWLLPCGLGAILTKPLELVLCFGLFKTLSFEAQRYRETAPDLPPGLRR